MSLLAGAVLLAAGPAAAQSRFTLGDWELACENTRTCRAVGYQSDQDGDLPLALLVEREAGPDKPVNMRVMLGGIDRMLNTPPFQSQVRLVIDGRSYGQVVLGANSDNGALSPAQAAVVLRAVIGTGDVTFEGADYRWVLSTTGATAVLLRMDDVQGRVDTAGALVQKGNRPESKALPPIAPPVVRAAPMAEPRPGDDDLAEHIRPLLKVGQSDYCEWLETPTTEAGDEREKEPITVQRLSADRVLVSMLCWQDGHVRGYGAWVAVDKPPYAPQLVTANATDLLGNTIESHQPVRRDVGDCWSADQWTWDGRSFIHTSSSTTGMCKLVAAGGAWTLPTIVTAGGTTSGR